MKSKREFERENETLRRIIKETFWMARRYAHGRCTYAPSMVRECYVLLKTKFPDLLPKKDTTILPTDYEQDPFSLKSDYLDDCNEDI